MRIGETGNMRDGTRDGKTYQVETLQTTVRPQRDETLVGVEVGEGREGREVRDIQTSPVQKGTMTLRKRVKDQLSNHEKRKQSGVKPREW
jgi:hypothetical protein